MALATVGVTVALTTTAPVVLAPPEVDADASRLTMAIRTQEPVSSVTSLGIRYVAGLWKSWFIVPLFMVSKFTYQNHFVAYAIPTNAQSYFVTSNYLTNCAVGGGPMRWPGPSKVPGGTWLEWRVKWAR